MKKIALSVSYAAPPTDSTDLWRIEKYLGLAEGFDAQIFPLYLDEFEAQIETIARDFDGLILAGGADLPTDWYGEAPLEGANLDEVNPRRPLFEKRLVADFEALRKPVFGICYGCQFLNVWKGGTLIQDLVLQTGTTLEHADGFEHPVEVAPDSLLHEIVGETSFLVPSFHHQAIKDAAPGAVICAFAPDGTPEAIEWRGDSFFLGVQWHPERAPHSNATRKLMAAFLAAA